jgi:hypothetical protein
MHTYPVWIPYSAAEVFYEGIPLKKGMESMGVKG